MLVLDPGQSYRVSVFNIPKPELGHSSYDISKYVDVEGEKNSALVCLLFSLDDGMNESVCGNTVGRVSDPVTPPQY